MFLIWKGAVVLFVATWGVARAQPLFTAPVQILTGTDSDAIGHACTGIGDIDGDGYGDLAAGHRTLLCSGIRPGAVFIVRGGPNGVPAGQAAACAGPGNYQVLTVSADGAWFGWAISPLGDIDGDGYDDIGVGAPYFTDTFFEQGAVFVYRGSASGLLPAPVATITGEAAGDHFGWSISGAGDVNGDDIMDLVVGAPGFDAGAGAANAGAAYRFHGGSQVFAANTASAASRFWTGTSNGQSAGSSLALIGDQNGDGFDDMLAGTGAGGPIRLFNGSVSGLSSTSAWNSGAVTFIDMRVGAAGDVNGDGYADLLVGDLAYPGPPNSQGRTLLWHGGSGGPGATFDWSHDGSQCCSASGCSVFAAGDADGDGYADILIGERGADLGPGDGHGQVLVFRGSANGLPPPPNATTAFQPTATTPGAHTGHCVSSAGDLNGDGRSDIVFSAPGPGTNGGWVYVSYGAVTYPSTDPVTLLGTGGQSNMNFGESFEIAGDLNGDGRDDAVTSSPRWELQTPVPGSPTRRGAVWIYYGTPGGLSPAATPTLMGPADFTSFGSDVAGAGDVNGDGYADLIVGAQEYSNGEAYEGAAFLYLGSPIGIGQAADWTFETNVANTGIGYTVAGAGDIDADGFDDFLIASFLSDPNLATGTSIGRVYVRYGSPTGVSAVKGHLFDGLNYTGLGGWFGLAATGVGDLDRDGCADIAIGAPHANSGRGAVFVFRGSPNGVDPVPAAVIPGQPGSDYNLGTSISRLGDTDGDGAAEFIVGRLGGHPTISGDQGNAYLYRLSSATPNSFYRVLDPSFVSINTAGSCCGPAVAAAGDQDGDGKADAMVGFPFHNVDAGVFGAFGSLGSSGSGVTSPLWGPHLGPSGSATGWAVSGHGDVNGDGFADLVYSALWHTGTHYREGATYLVLGRGSDGVTRRLRQEGSGGCRPIALGGQSPHADRFDVRMEGRSPLGRDDVRLEVEIKPVGAPYTGSDPLTTTATDTGAPLAGQGSMVPLLMPVTGLQPGTSYAWRARLRSRSPFWPRSPWFALSGGSWTDVKVRTAPMFRPRLSLDWPGLTTAGGVAIQDGPPGAAYLTVLSADPGNAIYPGAGWWGGLHISFSEVLNLYLSGVPPFVGALDACGGYLLPIPPIPPPGLNVTLYGVSLLWSPEFTGFTNPDSIFIP